MTGESMWTILSRHWCGLLILILIGSLMGCVGIDSAPIGGKLPQQVAAITWNGWFEYGSESDPKDVSELELNQVYRFNLDLSRYRYSTTLSADPDVSINKLLDGEGERVLLLHPVLLGDQLQNAPDKSLRPKEIAVRLERTQVGLRDAAVLARFRQHKIATRTLSNEVNLGGFVSWDIKATRVGCGGIAVTVWDQARSVPLDHIVLRVPVRRNGEGPESCGWRGTAQAMTAGLRSMLEGPLRDASARTPDAALHVFETMEEGIHRSYAVLLHRKRLLASLANPNTADSGVYSWQLASILSTYVSNPNHMPKLIAEAHQAILANSGEEFPFDEVARELALNIFSGNSEYDREQAVMAREALRDVINSTKDPSVVVRVVAANGKTVFIPFGLIAARSDDPVVSKRFTVIQPLPVPRRLSSSCVGSWNVARPQILQGVGGDARKLLLTAAKLPSLPQYRLLDNHGLLSNFLMGGKNPVPGRGEGLILLAHHDHGYLRFNDSERSPARIGHNYITHMFEPGSVAVLAACTTVGSADGTSAIVNRLVSQGIDTLIASPFAIDAEYGTRFALEFERMIVAEHAKARDVTIRQIFERASANTLAAYENQVSRQDTALEFILIGNPDVRLCN